ncbi:MAG TPA: hypothetical protein VEC18_10580 [Myxococcota bacterium]|nr:hypothetical protein [Myxococcota bacterium]
MRVEATVPVYLLQINQTMFDSTHDGTDLTFAFDPFARSLAARCRTRHNARDSEIQRGSAGEPGGSGANCELEWVRGPASRSNPTAMPPVPEAR